LTVALLAPSQPASTPTRFDREKYFPSTFNTGAERFCSLFHRFGFIYKPLTGGSWLSADEKWQLTDTEILKAIACAHPKFFIGARSGKASRFAVLDIDTDSEYHNLQQFKNISQVLRHAGIKKIVPYQSSDSGGWHLYIFFDQAVSSRDLHNQLNLVLKLNGFNVQKGQLEIFPNPGESSRSIGHGLRLPLQPGWAWLNPATMEIEAEREDIHSIEALGLFLYDLDNSSNTYEDFHKLKRYAEDILSDKQFTPPKPIRIQTNDNVVALRANKNTATEEAKSEVQRIFGDLPPGILADVWLKGRRYYSYGLSGPSQRADAIFSLGHYLFYGDPEIELPALGYGAEQEREWLLEEILYKKHNGHSKDINKGRGDALTQIHRATHWRPASQQDQEHTPYSSEIPVAWVLENKRREKDARWRIENAVEQLRKSGAPFSASDIRAFARCSWSTLYKHQDLWKSPAAVPADTASKYEQIADGLFAISTHEYNAVVGDSLSDSVFCFEPTKGSLFSEESEVVVEMETSSPVAQFDQLQLEEEINWRNSVLANLPPEFQPVTAYELRRWIAFLIFRRASAPSEESVKWVDHLIGIYDSELEKLTRGTAVRQVETANISSAGLSKVGFSICLSAGSG
jgi:hypothetical protein